MSHITGTSTVSGLEAFGTTGDAPGKLGQMVQDSQGRFLRLVKAGGSEISPGKLQLAPAPKTNHHGMAITNTDGAVQDTTIEVTPGATAVVANEYSGGYLNIVDDTGEAHAYEVESHPAADASTAFTVTLKDPILVALGDSATADLVHNPYNGVVEGTTATQTPVGVALTTIASGEYGWVVAQGEVGCLADEALTLGALLTIGTSTAGSVEEVDDVTAALTEFFVGRALVSGTDTEYPMIRVNLL